MKIDSIPTNNIPNTTNDSSTKKDTSSFADLLAKSLNDVNKLQITADNTIKEIATGKMDNIQDAVMAIEKADISMRLLLEVKNKAVQAYNQIMNMQV
ncbi:Flagellar hook-basal body complex protein FliE [Desulfurella amilsii]|uniref:Flagellar hook-basal body complex protein FliE n=1 Tax=Desulfurella amilsii TaxID=1562698 RepID=A0A1X4XVR2_9BACT|nr:flagellar hook-basal body complex protein FliE [Desulfurella amilsii]OSS41620.1 Flagellar hook-basal body complex protein FliE [Desulfurella amilsii]